MSAISHNLDTSTMDLLTSWMDAVGLPLFVVEALPDGRLKYCHTNKALQEVKGRTNAELVGRTPEELFPIRKAERLVANYRQCLAQETPFRFEQSLMVRGRETWWQTTLSKPDGFDGKVILGASIPITDAKEREFDAAQSLAELTVRYENLRVFSMMATHDARGPLASIASLVDLVREDFTDMGDGKAKILKLVSDTIDKALCQISETVQRVRTIEVAKEIPKVVDFGRMCEDIAATIDPQRLLSIEIPKALLECDEVMVQMGMRNLMTNAARFCDQQITLEIADNQTADLVTIEVTDDGPGMPDGVALHSLVHHSEAYVGGHALGLREISKLINSRGGSLEIAEPEADETVIGPRFRMHLPGRMIHDGHQTNMQAPSTPEPTPEPVT